MLAVKSASPTHPSIVDFLRRTPPSAPCSPHSTKQPTKPPRVSTTPQAKEASLAFLRAPAVGDDYGQEAGQAFAALTWGKPLKAKVLARVSKSVFYHLCVGFVPNCVYGMPIGFVNFYFVDPCGASYATRTHRHACMCVCMDKEQE